MRKVNLGTVAAPGLENANSADLSLGAAKQEPDPSARVPTTPNPKEKPSAILDQQPGHKP